MSASRSKNCAIPVYFILEQNRLSAHFVSLLQQIWILLIIPVSRLWFVIDNSNREAIKLLVDKILHEMHNLLGKQRTLYNSNNTTTNTLLVQGGQRDGHLSFLATCHGIVSCYTYCGLVKFLFFTKLNNRWQSARRSVQIQRRGWPLKARLLPYVLPRQIK